MGVINKLLVGFKGLFHKMELIPGTVIRDKNLWLDRSQALEENLLLLFY